ncbi:MAG TPA: 2,3-bisphosphoglycerate-dependent phosphoglycerate mutase [Gammaproteobacteria bacterium]|mgnify:FL=1|nr:2,3-bisphosphoglycerate-dependent phosphoglycerate mutase [Gammaproteobacteria bacterium]
MTRSNLVLVRHGQSEWNEKNLFTGWKDPELTQKGAQEARSAGRELLGQEYVFDVMYTSALKRAQETGRIILEEMGLTDIVTVRDQRLNERDYGDLSGLNKDDARERWGEDQVHVWRRSYDTPPPGGESLKDTANRVLPYFEEVILPSLVAGKNVLVAAHGNSLRALIMKIESISPLEIVKLEIDTGKPIYFSCEDGKVAPD